MRLPGNAFSGSDWRAPSCVPIRPGVGTPLMGFIPSRYASTAGVARVPRRLLATYYVRMHADSCMDPYNPDVVVAAEIFSMLSDVTRVRIVVALVNHEEMPVGELSKLVQRSPAAVSQHLAKLRLARIVAGRQDGNHVYYRLANEHVELLVRAALEQAEHASSDTPAHHRSGSAGDVTRLRGA